MAEKPKWFTFGATTGQAMVVGGRTITPEAYVLALNTPVGGFVWNRPTAVLVESAGVTERVPIIDVTRYAILGLTALTIIISWMGRRNGRSPS
jgi:hypothetical protein